MESLNSFSSEDSFVGSKSTNKAIKSRHNKIIELVGKNGFVTVEEMASLFGVTPQTIRRDINQLDKEGLISRYHGGAGLSMSTENVSYLHRKEIFLSEKKEIADTLAAQIPDNSSLFINIGTTTELVAKALCNHKKLRIITNNINVASIVSKNSDFEVIITGGIVRHRDGGITGEATIDFISQFKVDYGIIGISGIDMDGTLLDFDYREVRVARTIIDNSRKVFLVADHSKFGRNAMVKLGNIGEIEALITDCEPPAPLRDIIKEQDVRLITTA